MASTPTGPTRTQHVQDALRNEILRGERAPGSPLKIAELAKQFEASMSVVREALIRLGEHHLVISTPNLGFRVMETSAEDLRDLVDMRVQLEVLALERSIDRGDMSWEVSVIAAHALMERTPFLHPDGLGTTDEWAQAHGAFHEALGAACGSRRLLNFTRTLRDTAELYRQLSGTHGSRDVAAEHLELMTLATSRKRNEASAALTHHLQATADAVLANAYTDRSGS